MNTTPVIGNRIRTAAYVLASLWSNRNMSRKLSTSSVRIHSPIPVLPIPRLKLRHNTFARWSGLPSHSQYGRSQRPGSEVETHCQPGRTRCTGQFATRSKSLTCTGTGCTSAIHKLVGINTQGVEHILGGDLEVRVKSPVDVLTGGCEVNSV